MCDVGYIFGGNMEWKDYIEMRKKIAEEAFKTYSEGAQ